MKSLSRAKSIVLEPVFDRLRRILRPFVRQLVVTADTPTHYALSGPVGPMTRRIRGPRHKAPMMPVAWIEIRQAYVSYHLMPVYCLPGLGAGISPGLKARQQGKACFNFKVIDEALLAELQALTEQGITGFKKSGFIE